MRMAAGPATRRPVSSESPPGFERQPASWPLPQRRALAERFPAHIDGGRFAPLGSLTGAAVTRERNYIQSCGTAYIDGLDDAHSCARVHRRNAARAIQDEFPFELYPEEGIGYLHLSCPNDGPRVCAGTVTVSRGGRISVRQAFTIERDDIDSVVPRQPTEVPRHAQGQAHGPLA